VKLGGKVLKSVILNVYFKLNSLDCHFAYMSLNLGNVCNFFNMVNKLPLNGWIAVVMNGKGHRKKQSWPDIKILSKHLLGQTEENHKKFIWLAGAPAEI
jgi:hypothetical protein